MINPFIREIMIIFQPSNIMAKAKKAKLEKKKATAEKSFNWLPLLLILGLAALAMGKVVNFDFLSNWDDEAYIIRNGDIQKFSIENIGKIFSSFYVSNYQPVTMLVYMVEFSLFKMQPGAYHTVNLLIHLVNIFLVFRLVQRWTKDDMMTWIIAAIFAIHPTHVESVAWIAELKDVLYACFFLLSLDFYTRYLKEGKSKVHYRNAIIMFLLSCLSKPMAVTLPVVLLLIDHWYDRKFDKKAILEKIPFFLIAIVFGVLALYTQSDKAMDVALKVGFVNRVVLVFYGMFMYLAKLVWPFGLAGIHYYPLNPDGSLPALAYATPFIFIGVMLLLWRWKLIRKEVIFGLGFFFVTIGIVVQLVPFGHAIIAERYTYIPYIGLSLIIAKIASLIAQGKIVKSLKGSINYIAMGLIAFFAIVTYQRTDIWENSLSFYGDVVEKYPDSDHGHWMRGNVFKDYKRIDDAINCYNRAIELNPQYAMAYFNRGVMYAEKKSFKRAIDDYNKTIEYQDDDMAAYHNRANAYRGLGDVGNAIADYSKALEIDSTFVISYAARAETYFQLKKYDLAIYDYSKLLEYSPNDAQALYMLGVTFLNTGQKQRACDLLTKASALNNEEAKKALGSYCGNMRQQ